MKSNPSAMIIAGAVSVAAVAGITYAVVQPSPQPSTVAPTVSPSAIAQSPQTLTPIAPTSTTSPAAGSSGTAPNSAGTSSNGPSDNSPSGSSSNAPATPPASATAFRSVESCVVKMAVVDDPNPPLNVRATPATTANIVGQLKNGTFVTVVDEQNNWFQITTPMKGWISKPQTDSSCGQKVERVSFAPGGTSATISDRFIGAGTHKYLFNIGKGQTLTVTRNKGPFPMVIAPNGSTLVGNPAEDRSSWTTEVSQTGDYALALDSNYKGYKYSFVVEVK